MNKKTVLVTGSSIGLGSTIIKKFASNNYNCVINYLNHEKEALKLKEELEKKYNIECLCIKADISNDKDVENMKNQILNKFNKIDVLINNASISKDLPIDMKTKDDFMKILEVNLYGTFNISRAFGKMMYESLNEKYNNLFYNYIILLVLLIIITFTYIMRYIYMLIEWKKILFLFCNSTLYRKLNLGKESNLKEDNKIFI